MERVNTGRAAVATALLLGGCTMCPSPYDYSGPVPNGSPPHNDFRARSNGILPIAAAPRPWPPVVERRSSGEAVVAVLAETTPEDADGAGPR